MRETVSVTQADIDLAREQSTGDLSRHCPIAQALIRQHPADWFVTVGTFHVFGGPPVRGSRVCARMPPAAREFLIRFGDDQPVQPFKFRVQWAPEKNPKYSKAKED